MEGPIEGLGGEGLSRATRCWGGGEEVGEEGLECGKDGSDGLGDNFFADFSFESYKKDVC